MARQGFFDPHRTRWRRMRPLFDAGAVAITLVFLIFFWSVLRGQNLPSLALEETKPGYKPYKEKKRHTARKNTHRKTKTAPSWSCDGYSCAPCAASFPCTACSLAWSLPALATAGSGRAEIGRAHV